MRGPKRSTIRLRPAGGAWPTTAAWRWTRWGASRASAAARYAADRVGAGAPRDVIDAANNAKLLEGLAGVEDSRRTARFICHLALAEGQRVIVETFDTFEGFIARQPSGSNGFGYDPLFFLPDRGCTSAQLAPEEKNLISHRGKALRHFASLLKNILVGRAI